MKNIVAILAVALFTVSMNVNAQEKKTSGPAKKEATTKKEECSKEEKKACSTGEKKACCSAKKA
ncbi:hypothetical protein FSS13T_21690 [Flavobacterium saliperosum S13]|uniref:Uncharacterized protein n=2 Tax=Flavobacterium saliperosum TaxID=329186 RepID=A0A1G4VQ62_9FLAO|nr:hypothetical protein [Flavobacterium saliperosum]ESU23864.1 hypothetical protein FSS13T_21690 [Flavobacterium saliperosum S13]SCX10244.1 hypothetical protein SAMN02927925_01528 [Flavobacterium saliperosum]